MRRRDWGVWEEAGGVGGGGGGAGAWLPCASSRACQGARSLGPSRGARVRGAYQGALVRNASNRPVPRVTVSREAPVGVPLCNKKIDPQDK